ncbi:MAG: hypothetical protein SNJ70_03750 [Armatimonadota bacterium]
MKLIVWGIVITTLLSTWGLFALPKRELFSREDSYKLLKRSILNTLKDNYLATQNIYYPPDLYQKPHHTKKIQPNNKNTNLDLSKELYLLNLMGNNYEISIKGESTVAKRPVWVFYCKNINYDFPRFQFWVDKEKYVILAYKAIGVHREPIARMTTVKFYFISNSSEVNYNRYHKIDFKSPDISKYKRPSYIPTGYVPIELQIESNTSYLIIYSDGLDKIFVNISKKNNKNENIESIRISKLKTTINKIVDGFDITVSGNLDKSILLNVIESIK